LTATGSSLHLENLCREFATSFVMYSFSAIKCYA